MERRRLSLPGKDLCHTHLAKYARKSNSLSLSIMQDKKQQTVVNNDSGQIMEMLNSEFDGISQDASCPDLFPKQLQAEINELNEYIHDNVNTGVYKCGFAESQVSQTSHCIAVRRQWR